MTTLNHDWLGFDLKVRDDNVTRIVGENLLKQMQAFVDAVEESDGKWDRPWFASQGMPASWVRKKNFRGINILMAMFSPYRSRWWFTFNDVKKLGGSFREGENKRHRPIMLAFPQFETNKGKPVLDENGNQKISYFKLRYFAEWNFEQIDFPQEVHDKIMAYDQVQEIEHTPIELAEKLLSYWPDDKLTEIEDDKGRNYYRVTDDSIRYVPLKRFKTPSEYYSTRFHERSHATGHKDRLARPSIANMIVTGTDDYAFEELVAETASFIICSFIGLDNATKINSAAYVKHWLKQLNGDGVILASAMKMAKDAAEYQLKPVFENIEKFDEPEPEAKNDAVKKKTAKKKKKSRAKASVKC